MTFHLIKLGGSLIFHGKDIVRSLYNLSVQGHSFLVVPGGGPMADLVRNLFEKRLISNEAAHWMAILAMEQYGRLLTDGTGATLIDNLEPFQGSAQSNGNVFILMPYLTLLRNDEGIEHNWNFTSDSIAAWVASILHMDFIKITDVDGVLIDGRVTQSIDASKLLTMDSCIDSGALRLMMKYGINCRVINGSNIGMDGGGCGLLENRAGTVIWGRCGGQGDISPL